MLPIVPMFHANAWGLPYAGVDGRRRLRDARPVPAGRAARALHRRRSARRSPARCRRSGPTSCATRDANPSVDLSSLRMIMCGGSAVPRSLMEAFEEQLRRAHHPGLGHDRDEPARRGRAPAEGRRARHAPRRWTGARRPAASSPGVELRIVDDDGSRAAVGRRGGRRDRGARPVDHRLVLPRPVAREVRRRLAAHRRRRHRSRRTASSRSPTAPRTSSSRAASGSRRSSSRTT